MALVSPLAELNGMRYLWKKNLDLLYNLGAQKSRIFLGERETDQKGFLKTKLWESVTGANLGVEFKNIFIH